MLINKKDQNSIRKVAAYPGADIESDHNFLTGTFKEKKQKQKQGINIFSLRDTRKHEMLKNELDKQIE